MPALFVMAGGGLLSALGSAQGARTSAIQNMIQFRHEEINRATEFANQSWFQVLNNAERWARNKAIAKDALSVREKTKFWDRVRHENSTSEMSKSMRQAYDNLKGELTGRMGAKSATSRALLRSSMQNYYKARETISIDQSLRGREREQTYRQTLGTRDFGFTPIAQFHPGKYTGASPDVAYKTALISGLASTAMSVGGAWASMSGGGPGGDPGGGDPSPLSPEPPRSLADAPWEGFPEGMKMPPPALPKQFNKFSFMG